MNYQKIVCWGDSQTFGARTYGCYPMFLVQQLNSASNYTWTTLNYSENGRTARDLWFAVGKDLTTLKDVYIACILIGTNDVGNNTPVELFGEYYRQILDALKIAGIKAIYCGEIPPIWPDGHAFFSKDANQKYQHYNEQVISAVESCNIAQLVQFNNLDKSSYVDPVHFNEAGNKLVASAFANAILVR